MLAKLREKGVVISFRGGHFPDLPAPFYEFAGDYDGKTVIPPTQALPELSASQKKKVRDAVDKVVADAGKVLFPPACLGHVKALAKALGQKLGQCVEGSTDILTFAISAALVEDPERVCLKIDTKNAFNSVSNSSLRAAAVAMPQIGPLTMLRNGGPITVNFKNHATGETITIEQSEGVSQGDTTAGFLYCLAEAPAVKEVQANHDVLVLGYQDDKHFIGKPDEVFATLTCYEGALERRSLLSSACPADLAA